MSVPDGDIDPMELLRRAGGEEEVPSETRARVWSAVTSALLTSGAGLSAAISHVAPREAANAASSAAHAGEVGQASLAMGGDGLTPWVSKFLRWSAPALFVGAAAGVTAKGVLTPVEPAAVHGARRVAGPKVAPTAAPESSSAAPAPTIEPRAAEMPSPPPPAGESSANAKLVNRAQELARERTLLDQARAQIAAGEPARALEFVERHERRYQQGALVEEREALAINALVSVGRYREAAQRGEAFRARYPDSLLMPSIEAALAAIRE